MIWGILFSSLTNRAQCFETGSHVAQANLYNYIYLDIQQMMILDFRSSCPPCSEYWDYRFVPLYPVFCRTLRHVRAYKPDDLKLAFPIGKRRGGFWQLILQQPGRGRAIHLHKHYSLLSVNAAITIPEQVEKNGYGCFLKNVYIQRRYAQN